MTTEEKLKHFLDTCMEDARARSSRMIKEYTASLEKSFEEHQKDARHRSQLEVRQETDKIERDINKQLSMELLNLKRMLGQKQEELKEKLFADLQDKLETYRRTPEYERLLNRQFQDAVSLAGEDELFIYLDPSDKDKSDRLAKNYPSVHIRLNDEPFMGGTRAALPSRRILIDNSFQTKLAEARESFHLDLSLTEDAPKDSKKGGSFDAASKI